MKNKDKRAHLIGDLMGFFVLATASTGLGIVGNTLRDKPMDLVYSGRQERVQREVESLVADARPRGAEPGKIEMIPLEAFRGLVGASDAMILDARPEIFHRLGHVPGAVSLSRESFRQDYERLRDRLEGAREGAVAVYCSGASCEDADMVAEGLVKLGHRNVMVFKGGWDEWVKAGLPQETGQ